MVIRKFLEQHASNCWVVRKIYSLWYLVYGLVLILVTLKGIKEIVPCRNRKFDPDNESMKQGRVVVITGGPRGIAYELVKTFSKLNFRVIMGCQNVTSSQKNIDQMCVDHDVQTEMIHLVPLNLKSLAATKKFADKVLKITNRIDLLINNAGIMMTPAEITEDGYEAQFQVNYLSHFLLTSLLLPTIKCTGRQLDDDASSCRIISTTSAYHHAGSLDFDDLETRKIYSPAKCYFDSKLCQVMLNQVFGEDATGAGNGKCSRVCSAPRHYSHRLVVYYLRTHFSGIYS